MRIHFIAVGGAVMHNLAIALHKKGYQVTGSDDEIREPSKGRLAKYELLPEKEGWDMEKISLELDAVILGMHARVDNPELLEAQRLGVKIYSFPEYLYEQTKNKKRVVIGGSHGKTTVTSMVMHVLKKQGVKFDYMVGSQIEGFETMVGLSEDTDLAIFEGDEYLSSPLDPRPKFHLYKPHIAVITGIAWDHINVFPTFENYKEQFQIFVNKIQSGGYLFYTEHDSHIQEILNNCTGDINTKGYSALEYNVNNGEVAVVENGQEFEVKVFGKHNLENLHAAKLICEALEISEFDFFSAIKSFTGAARRLETIYSDKQTTVYWDFAHAPSKLKATVNAVKEMHPDKDVVACIELHTFSSLNKKFLDQYKGTMDKADKAIVFFEEHTLKLKRLPYISVIEVEDAFQKNDLEVIQQSELLKEKLNGIDWNGKILLLMTSGSFGGWDVKEEIKGILCR